MIDTALNLAIQQLQLAIAGCALLTLVGLILITFLERRIKRMEKEIKLLVRG